MKYIDFRIVSYVYRLILIFFIYDQRAKTVWQSNTVSIGYAGWGGRKRYRWKFLFRLLPLTRLEGRIEKRSSPLHLRTLLRDENTRLGDTTNCY